MAEVGSLEAKATSEPITVSGRHWRDTLPYAAVVPVAKHPNGTALYQVAGSASAPCGGFKALQNALKLHGGSCFYCKSSPASEVGETSLTIDHVEPTSIGGSNHLPNLVVACSKCNAAKGSGRIEAYNPEAGKEWLEALLSQVTERLARLT